MNGIHLKVLVDPDYPDHLKYEEMFISSDYILSIVFKPYNPKTNNSERLQLYLSNGMTKIFSQRDLSCDSWNTLLTIARGNHGTEPDNATEGRNRRIRKTLE